ncbi:ExbD/TolR family protein [Pelagibaculum spongiae]|uniref:Biopolymer transporter ExbD n=1 Tax=Pelagibaculum spongiae TaxID=2080658 RepID=A0A2V1GNG3_9GAMM|nr:biopolymer transporter ExbD [Pelagibaculum spongiae]PVZ62982.1 hypothetical protein DC094_21690 [Pelagibaculum spongiae]
MKMSRRAKRMSRSRSKHKRGVALNLVSLMDIFTILVFFLLVNSSNAHQLPSSKTIKLPKSHAEKIPEENVVVQVNRDEILIDGKLVARIENLLQQDSDQIAPLAAALQLKTQRWQALHSTEEMPKDGRKVTILADKGLSYQLLRKVMNTCSQQSYSQISLAVNRVPFKKEAS